MSPRYLVIFLAMMLFIAYYIGVCPLYMLFFLISVAVITIIIDIITEKKVF